MNQQVLSILHSLSSRLDKLEKKGTATKLGMNNGDDDARVSFHQNLRAVEEKYYIEELSIDEERLLNTSFEDKYGGKLTINQDDILPALLIFVDDSDETKKRIVGHLIRMYDQDWAHRAAYEH